ncbi:MAG: cytochrome c-type biogenesis protein CcmH [marine benthic group bacterium]|nr:cytochrome c-type biogenesis protein CcmH [Gemmatimonadota bacterium]
MSRVLARVITLFVVFAAAPPAVSAQEVEPEATTPAPQAVEAPAEQADDDRSALTDPEEEALDALAAEVASGLRCPVCRNQSIVESNADLSREMQAVVRDRLAAGETPEQIEAYFVSRYGEWILLRPQARGINLLVYGLPLVVLVLGFFLARNRLRKWASTGSDGVAAHGPADLAAEDEQWLREAIREG